MMWLKGCPRCRGDLFEEPAIGLPPASRSVSCLQCGHVLTDREDASLPRSVPSSRRPAVPAERVRVA